MLGSHPCYPSVSINNGPSAQVDLLCVLTRYDIRLRYDMTENIFIVRAKADEMSVESTLPHLERN